MKSTINWFEIPVADLARASTFYGKLLDLDLKQDTSGKMPMAVMMSEGVSGALVKFAERKPSPDGPAIYLNVDGRLDAVLSRVTKLGGEVVVPKTGLGEHGHFAMLRDTEGNHVGLHQR